MSKRIFINNLNTYVSQAIFNELRNDIGEDGERNADSNVIFGTYIDKDSSIKPDGIKKMLKVSPQHSCTLTVVILTVMNVAFKTSSHHEISV
jgi:hypothetical protein